MVLYVIFLAMSSPSAIAHNSSLRISLFFPRKTIVLFHLLDTLFFQEIAAPTFFWSNFDPLNYNTTLVWYLLTFWTAIFFSSTIIVLLNPLVSPSLLIEVTPSTGSIILEHAIFWTRKWVNSRGFTFSVYIRVSSGCSPGCEFLSSFFKLTAKISFIRWWSSNVNNQ